MLSFVGLLALTGAAVAYENGTYGATVTEVVSSYVTYCPSPTELVQGNKTYTVTEPTILTITDCPCTITTHATPYVVETTAYVSSYETYCPVATTIVEKEKTYSATAGETVTVDNCPCPVPITTTLTPGVPATEVKYVSSELSTVVYTPGPKLAPVAEKSVVAPPQPTVAAFTGAAARNEILGLGLLNLW